MCTWSSLIFPPSPGGLGPHKIQESMGLLFVNPGSQEASLIHQPSDPMSLFSLLVQHLD